MAWSEVTRAYYSACAKRRGAELIGQFGNLPRVIVRLPCGHERTISISSVSGRSVGAKPIECFDCRLATVQNK